MFKMNDLFETSVKGSFSSIYLDYFILIIGF